MCEHLGSFKTTNCLVYPMVIVDPFDHAVDCHLNGRVDEALASYVKALQVDPTNEGAAQLVSVILRSYYELALTLMKLGRDEEAVLGFNRVLAIQPNDSVAHAYLAKLLISSGKPGGASTHLRKYLKLVPEDHIGARMLLAHIGAEPIPSRAAASYVRGYYDNYARSYDQTLVENLMYRAPHLVAEALRRHCHTNPVILDLGCGTGLSGVAVHQFTKGLDGIDLSPAMIAKARTRDIYDTLEVADIYSLDKAKNLYDGIIAAGVFEHIGDPERIFNVVRKFLKPSGCFVFTAEENTTSELAVNSAGYYTHGRDYLSAKARSNGFTVCEMRAVQTRREGATAISGLCSVLRKN